jgi:hypothetical protein
VLVAVAVRVPVAVGPTVLVAVAVRVPVAVGPTVLVAVGISTVAVRVLVAVGISTVLVGVSVGVLVSVGISTVAVGVAVAADQPWLEIELPIRVTAPLRARSLPTTLAPSLRVMLSSARIFPANAVPDPRVAELPTCQKMLPWLQPLIGVMDAPLAVVSVLPILKMKTALESPWPSRTSIPVNCADESKQ